MDRFLAKFTALLKSFVSYAVLPFFTSATAGSIGRIFLLVTYIGMFGKFWWAGNEPPESMVQTFYACMAYVFSSKLVEWKSGSAGSSATKTAPVTTASKTLDSAATSEAG